MTQPNKPNIMLWVQALESGEFQQTQGKLGTQRNGVASYCCLGVACELAMRHGVVLDRRVGIVGTILYSYDDEKGMTWENDSHLPFPVQQWLGVQERDPAVRIPEEGVRDYLSALNDAHQWNFTQIATAIRSEFLQEDPE